MDNLQVFPLWPKENRTKKFTREMGPSRLAAPFKDMNAKALMTFSYDLTRAKTRS